LEIFSWDLRISRLREIYGRDMCENERNGRINDRLYGLECGNNEKMLQMK
jgi:hypothetical protein